MLIGEGSKGKKENGVSRQGWEGEVQKKDLKGSEG